MCYGQVKVGLVDRAVSSPVHRCGKMPAVQEELGEGVGRTEDIRVCSDRKS